MGRPKALLEYQGETFLGRITRIFEKFCDPVIVVLGHNADAVRDHIHTKLVINPDPDRGQLSSLQTALVQIDSDFLFTPVDCPTFREQTVAQLIEALTDDPIAIPRYHGRRGHPVGVARTALADFTSLPPTAETRAAIDAHPDRIAYVDVNDPGILADIDDLEAYQKIAT